MLAAGARLSANEGVLVLLSNKMRANVLGRGLLRLIKDCAVYRVAAILAFARLDEIDCAAPDCVK